MKPELKAIHFADPLERSDELIRFLARGAPHVAAAESWAWRYVNTPGGDGIISVMVDAAAGDRIVGHIAESMLRCKYREDAFTVGLNSGVLVSAEYRRQGIFRRLRELEDATAESRGAAMLISAPNKPLAAAALGTGYRLRQQFEFAVRALTFWRSDALRRPGRFLKQAGLYTLGRAIRRRAKPVDAELEALEGFDARVDDLWARVSQGDYLGVIKDSAYLHWRHALRPGSSFVACLGSVAGEPRALCIVEWSHISPGAGRLAELLARHEDEDVALAALAETERLAARSGVRHVTALVDGVSIIGPVLNRRGYVRWGARPFMVRPFTEAADTKYSGPWTFSMGDKTTGAQLVRA